MRYFHCEVDEGMVVMHMGDEKLIAWHEKGEYWNIEYYSRDQFDHNHIAKKEDVIMIFSRLTLIHMKNRNRAKRLNTIRKIS